MAKEDGANVLLKVGDGGTSETFTTLAGQLNTQLQIETDEIDHTAKDSGDFGEYAPGRMRVTVTCSGRTKWNDSVAALENLLTAAQNSAAINVECHVNSDGDKYAFSAIVSGGITGQDKESTQYDFTLRNAGTVTVPTY
ncbi:hypothetical protein E5163_14910 [Marinicauda algicola]|uniref:Phage tail protein n=1 Tax=Marinicauda algicola TaxID=2029849 RepID=A0A4S2GWB8_9PROT|nr:phage tail tube protein [Marinicauda algicola]TGY87356.1 hypothetical protein E5163_14910 [Marinicauda algicola]